MNHNDPDLAGDWPAIPADEGGSGCGTVGLIVAICVAVAIAATAMAVFAGRGCG